MKVCSDFYWDYSDLKALGGQADPPPSCLTHAAGKFPQKRSCNLSPHRPLHRAARVSSEHRTWLPLDKSFRETRGKIQCPLKCVLNHTSSFLSYFLCHKDTCSVIAKLHTGTGKQRITQSLEGWCLEIVYPSYYHLQLRAPCRVCALK